MIKPDEKPMDADEVTNISKADTIEAIGDFWDTHDFTDYDSDSPDVEFREAADRFTYDPYWDLDSLLDMCLAGPSYYPPWQEFGLGAIPPQVLRQRADAYLESVMRRIV